MEFIRGNTQKEIYITSLIIRSSVLSLVELTKSLIKKLCGLRRKSPVHGYLSLALVTQALNRE